MSIAKGRMQLTPGGIRGNWAQDSWGDVTSHADDGSASAGRGGDDPITQSKPISVALFAHPEDLQAERVSQDQIAELIWIMANISEAWSPGSNDLPAQWIGRACPGQRTKDSPRDLRAIARAAKSRPHKQEASATERSLALRHMAPTRTHETFAAGRDYQTQPTGGATPPIATEIVPRSRGIILRDAEWVGEDEMDVEEAPPPLDDGTISPGFAAECRGGKTPWE